MGNGKVLKLSNSYADVIPSEVYEAMPKTVLAAIAVSFASCGGDLLGDVTRAIVHEWQVLNENGIVPQRVPVGLRKYDVPTEER